jgi:outer membrane protein TolC
MRTWRRRSLTAMRFIPISCGARFAVRAVAVLALASTPVAAQSTLLHGRTARTLPTSDTLTLERAIRAAIDRNREVRVAALAVDEARGVAAEAWSGVLPAVNLNASYTRNISPPVSFLPGEIFDPDSPPGTLIPVRFGADNLWNSTVSLEQPLFKAQAFLGVGAARRYLALQNEVLRGAVQSVVTRVRVAYYDVLLASEQARLLESSVARVRSALDETQAMYRGGLASEYDVLRLEVELANLEPNLRRAQNTFTQARRTLAVEVGVPDLETAPLAATLADMDVAEVDANSPANREMLRASGVGPGRLDAEALASLAQESRSDIRQLELTRELRRADLKNEQFEYIPQITLFGSYVIAAQQNGSPAFFGSGPQRAYGRTAGIAVSMPIFNGFRENSRIRQRRAVVRSVETQTELARDRAEAEVRTLTERVAEAAERADAQRLAVRQARRGFEIAAAQYREGISSQLERTDAEVALRQSEFNYAQAVYDLLVAAAQLDEATGQIRGVEYASRFMNGGGR